MIDRAAVKVGLQTRRQALAACFVSVGRQTQCRAAQGAPGQGQPHERQECCSTVRPQLGRSVTNQPFCKQEISNALTKPWWYAQAVALLFKKSTGLRLGLSLKAWNWDLGRSAITRANAVESPLCTEGKGSVLDWWFYCISRNVQLTESNTGSCHCRGIHSLFIPESHNRSPHFELRLHNRFLKTDPHLWSHGQWSILPQG